MGIADAEFFTELKLAGAIMDLNYNMIETHPNATFARLGLEHQVTPLQIVEIQRDLGKRLEEKYKEHRGAAEYDFGLDSRALNDWRILFPVFREVYEADRSEGPQRQYLDTIWQGLQKWFPTLTNGPVPEVTPGSTEPPRSVPRAQPAPKQGPTPGPAAPGRS